jgi:uncharacterized membrane protein
MKTKKCALLFLCCLALFKSFGQQSLEMYNNTGNDIYSAIAQYDQTNACWTTKGWYKIEPYKTATVTLSTLNEVYIHAHSTIPASNWLESATTKTWGSGYNLCVDSENAFEIRNADKIDCDERMVFFKKDIKKGVNKTTFNP